MTREYCLALDELEQLIVSHIFELTKMNMSGTGYKLRKHIAKALQARLKAVRAALTWFNAATACLKRDELGWEEVVVGDVNPLRDRGHTTAHLYEGRGALSQACGGAIHHVKARNCKALFKKRVYDEHCKRLKRIEKLDRYAEAVGAVKQLDGFQVITLMTGERKGRHEGFKIEELRATAALAGDTTDAPTATNINKPGPHSDGDNDDDDDDSDWEDVGVSN
ncbi:hypothetical protein CPB85DRAFT_1441634 [Mucidula mucida]|nr:hypothetical protein CPB85DRAFT_1441634 [Mucidula mucida]